MNPIQLFIPGPVPVADDVLEVLSRPVVAHYGPQCVSDYNRTTGLLNQLLGSSGETMIIAGSGSAALDMAVNSVVEKGAKVILVNNGFFGWRLKDMLVRHSAKVIEIAGEWGKPIEAGRIEDALKKTPGVRAVLTTHCETSCGILNPIEDIGRIVKTTDALFIVDGVTSIGGERYCHDEWGIDISVTASQKCLACSPGLSVASFSRKAVDYINNRKTKPAGWYLNPAVWFEYIDKWKDWHPYPMTLPINPILSLQRSLETIIQEGIEKRINRHRSAAAEIRSALRSMGYKMVASDSDCAGAVTAVKLKDSSRLQEYLKKEHHIQIANGLAETHNQWFRIGHMGDIGTRPEYYQKAIDAISQFKR